MLSCLDSFFLLKEDFPTTIWNGQYTPDFLASTCIIYFHFLSICKHIVRFSVMEGYMIIFYNLMYLAGP